jgi:cell division septum initiation protein DivIVA
MFEPVPPATVAPAHSVDEWQSLIQEAKHLDEALQQLRQRTAAFRATTSTSQRSIQASPTDVQQALEAVHNQAATTILALHAQLQTHLTLEELQHAQALMHDLDAIVLGKAGKDLEQQVRAAAINRLVQECAPLAWQTLLTLMARAQVSWPDPTGLSPHADAQAVQAARQWELADLEKTFLESSLERSANRVFGVVENWKAHYPSPESHPWKRMVLQAVGSGILGYLLSVADAKLRGDAPDFIARVEHVLREELATMQQALQVGVHSVTDADALMVSIAQLCEEVVPTMAWETAAPDVHKALQRFEV